MKNIIISISIAVLLLFSTSSVLCSSTDNFIEVGQVLIQDPDINKGPRRYLADNPSILFTIENNGAQWDLIFHPGGKIGNNYGLRHKTRSNYYQVEIYKNNEFIDKLLVKNTQYLSSGKRQYIAESKGRNTRIKMISMHDNWYKLILHAHPQFVGKAIE